MNCSTITNHKEPIREALGVLGKKNFAFIMHNPSFPSATGENTGFGSVNSNGGKEFIEYASGIFNSIQLGPAGKTKGCDSSPYTGTIFSNNPLFADLKELTTDKWGKILSEATYNEIVECNPNKETNRTAYGYVYKKYQEAFGEAWDNFKKPSTINHQPSTHPQLSTEFNAYKNANTEWLDKDALYEALSIEHGNDYWPLWNNETDKSLFNPKSIEQKMEFAQRINEIEKKYADEINKYKFIQFVVSRQSAETAAFAQKYSVKMIADRQVAFSERDIWAYQSLFLEGWSLGCPPDYFSEDGQAWGFPVLDPEKMYKADGSLDEGGLLMKNLYKKMFRENPGGVRIDHIVGLIDPWVYHAGAKPKIEEGAGRLFSSPEHSVLGKYAIAGLNDLDLEIKPDKEKRVKTLSDEQIRLYGRLIQIVIDAATEEGLDKDAIVCEDLGTLTNPVVAVMKAFDLQGMKLTQFVEADKPADPYRCCNINDRTWVMAGTHDNEPIKMWADNTVNTENGYLHAQNLAADLHFESMSQEEVIHKLNTDAAFLAQTKLVELFASCAQNVQIFFTDYFNIYDTYNCPGTCGDLNWSLRLPDNYKQLWPVNLAQILRLAILARGTEFACEHAALLEKLNEI
jgi:4-alpha-glucanotransferase